MGRKCAKTHAAQTQVVPCHIFPGSDGSDPGSTKLVSDINFRYIGNRAKDRKKILISCFFAMAGCLPLRSEGQASRNISFFSDPDSARAGNRVGG